MIINSENLNFVDSQADFDLLLRQVEQMRVPREYFDRGSSRTGFYMNSGTEQNWIFEHHY